MDKLLNLIEKNPRLSNKEIAVMLGIDEKEVEEKIRLYEDTGVIKGYRAMIDKDKAQAQTVTALIEIKVHPKFEHGFDEVAQQISSLEEVESVYLMSGGFVLYGYRQIVSGGCALRCQPSCPYGKRYVDCNSLYS